MANTTYGKGRALCTDGKVRGFRLTAQGPDTFFSWPAAVTAKGKTVTGFVAHDTLADDPQGTYSIVFGQFGSPTHTTDDTLIRFRAYKYRKNAGLLAEVME